MKAHINKRVVMFVLFVLLATAMPVPTTAQTPVGGTRTPISVCTAAGRWEFLFAATAFGFMFTPFTPVTVAFGAAAIVAKGVQFATC